MREDLTHQYPQTRKEKEEILAEAAVIMAAELFQHECSNPECEVVKWCQRILQETLNEGLIEFRREKATGYIQHRFTHPLAEIMFLEKLDRAVELKQPAIMAQASF